MEERSDGLDVLLADCLRVWLVEELAGREVHVPLDASNETAHVHAVKRGLPRLEGLLSFLDDAIVEVVDCVVPVHVIDFACLNPVGVEGGFHHVDYATAHASWQRVTCVVRDGAIPVEVASAIGRVESSNLAQVWKDVEVNARVLLRLAHNLLVANQHHVARSICDEHAVATELAEGVELEHDGLPIGKVGVLVELVEAGVLHWLVQATNVFAIVSAWVVDLLHELSDVGNAGVAHNVDVGLVDVAQRVQNLVEGLRNRGVRDDWFSHFWIEAKHDA